LAEATLGASATMQPAASAAARSWMARRVIKAIEHDAPVSVAARPYY
jgi:hypothetical protein